MVEHKIPGGVEYVPFGDMYPFACDMGPHDILECGRKNTQDGLEYAPIGRKSCQGGGASVNGYDEPPICPILECKAGVSKSINPVP